MGGNPKQHDGNKSSALEQPALYNSASLGKLTAALRLGTGLSASTGSLWSTCILHQRFCRRLRIVGGLISVNSMTWRLTLYASRGSSSSAHGNSLSTEYNETAEMLRGVQIHLI